MADVDAEDNAAENENLEHAAQAETAAEEPVKPVDDSDEIEREQTTKSAGATGPGDDAGVTGPDDDIGAAVDHDTRQRRWTRPIFAKAAAAVIAAAILASTGLLGWLCKDQHDKDIAARQAHAAAVRFAEVLTNVDGAKIEENFHRTIEGSTGEFKDMYMKSSAHLRRALVENKASAHGVIVESAIKSATKNTVEVLLFVDQSVSNSSAPEPRLDRSRVEITMQKVDGRWLASKVQLP